MTSTLTSANPKAVLYIAQEDLKERYKKKTEHIKSYCTRVRRIGSTTRLQVGVNEQPDGTIGIKVEAYPLESLAKAVQYLIEEFVEVKCWAKYTIPDAHKANEEISVQKQREIKAEGEYCPPLSEGALRKHDLETSCELQQFRCPQCFKWWWRTVPRYKPVSKCPSCRLCLNPLKPLEQFGVGRFVCQCGNVFYRKCQGSDSHKCANCSRKVHKPYIRQYFRTDDTRHIQITPEQQYPSGNGYYHYPSSYFVPHARPYNDPAMSNTLYDLPQPRRRACSTLRDHFPPQFYMGDTHYFPASNPPHMANPAAMHQPYSAGGFAPTLAASSIHPSEATRGVSLYNHNTNVNSSFCTANNQAAPIAIRSPAATTPHPPGDPRLAQPLVSASPTPACSTISGGTTMAVTSLNVPPDLDYTPLETLVIPPSTLNPQPVSESNPQAFPQPLLTTSSASAVLPLALVDEDASVSAEATAIPSSCINPPSISENFVPQPPLTTPSTGGLLPMLSDAVATFPSAISSAPSVVNSYTQPPLDSSSTSFSLPDPLAGALTNLHLSETSCAQPNSETGSTLNQDLSQSVDAPVTLISPLQSVATPPDINPPLVNAETTASTVSPSTGVLVKASHPSSDHSSLVVDYNPPETTAIPSPIVDSSARGFPSEKESSSLQNGTHTTSNGSTANDVNRLHSNPSTPSIMPTCSPTTEVEVGPSTHPCLIQPASVDSGESQSHLTAPKRHNLSHTKTTADTMTLAVATNPDPSHTEESTPASLKVLTDESSTTVSTNSHSLTVEIDAVSQTKINISICSSTSQMTTSTPLCSSRTANPLPVSSVLPVSGTLPHPSQPAATVSMPQAGATRFESKAVQTATPSSVNVVNFFNLAVGAELPNPQRTNDRQATSYHEARVRIRRNPRDLKYKQVSTLHDCSGTTESSCFVPQLKDSYRNTKLKLHHAHRRTNRNEDVDSEYDLDYDMMEVSSEEEEEEGVEDQ